MEVMEAMETMRLRCEIARKFYYFLLKETQTNCEILYWHKFC